MKIQKRPVEKVNTRRLPFGEMKVACLVSSPEFSPSQASEVCEDQPGVRVPTSITTSTQFSVGELERDNMAIFSSRDWQCYLGTLHGTKGTPCSKRLWLGR